MDQSRAALIWMLAVLVLPLLVFGQTVTFDFVNYDDNAYVYDNPVVLEGLSLEGVRWAFSAPRVGNYHPVTWLSHMLDVELFGTTARGHHAVNVLLHSVNSLLLFLLVRAWTGSPGSSVVAALLFAVHPLHVESVAWISERKDVLSTFFMLLALAFYTQYVRTPSRGRYVAVLAVYLIGLLSKPMLVTLPVLLLLLDYWPLRRFRTDGNSLKRLTLEKVPLFVLAAGLSIMTLFAQRHAGMMRVDTAYPLADRCANAALACIRYLVQAIWPAHLTPFYPYPLEPPPFWKWGGAIVLLILISAWAWRVRRDHPYFLVGWLWYLVTLAPVIGIIQVGLQSHADRYTYVPLIGIFISVVIGAPAIAARLRLSPRALRVVAGVAVLLFAAMAFVQTGHWRNSETLWKHTLISDPDNALAYQNLGVHYYHTGRVEEAETALHKVLEFGEADPRFQMLLYGPTYNTLAGIERDRGAWDQAINHYASAVRWSPESAEYNSNFGDSLLLFGRPEEAAKHLQKAVDLDPSLASSWSSLAHARILQQKGDEALGAAGRAVALDPRKPEYRFQMAQAEYVAGRHDAALSHLDEVMKLDENFGPAIKLREEIVAVRDRTADGEPTEDAP